MRMQVAVERRPDEVAVEGVERGRGRTRGDRRGRAREHLAQEIVVERFDNRAGGGPAGFTHEPVRGTVIAAFAVRQRSVAARAVIERRGAPRAPSAPRLPETPRPSPPPPPPHPAPHGRGRPGPPRAPPS